MLFDIFCTSPVENVSFVPETQDLPRNINSPCIFFLTKIIACVASVLVRTILKFIQLSKFCVILHLKPFLE